MRRQLEDGRDPRLEAVLNAPDRPEPNAVMCKWCGETLPMTWDRCVIPNCPMKGRFRAA